MNKGVVMTIGRKWATVLTEDCLLVKTSVRPDMAVGKEILVDTMVKTKSPAIHSRSLKYVFLAAGLVLVMAVVLLAGRGLFKESVYAVVSIDVNPSMELSLDRDLEVISARAMNEDAERIMDGQQFEGLFWKEAVERWTEALRAKSQVQLQNMLISAVMPEEAEQLRTELMSMEGTADQGVLAGVAVRVIFSNDEAVTGQAAKSGLSVGRQMLLNQAQVQNRNWDVTNIEDAPLGELVQALLGNGEQNQTRLTQRATENMTNQTGDPTLTGAAETNRETNRETNEENGASAQGTGTASGVTSQNTSQNMSEQTNMYANGETNGATQNEQAGSQQTIQSTLQETIRETLESGESSSTGTAAESSQQQTSQAKATAGR